VGLLKRRSEEQQSTLEEGELPGPETPPSGQGSSNKDLPVTPDVEAADPSNQVGAAGGSSPPPVRLTGSGVASAAHKRTTMDPSEPQEISANIVATTGGEGAQGVATPPAKYRLSGRKILL
jgi:hypothetical protein